MGQKFAISDFFCIRIEHNVSFYVKSMLKSVYKKAMMDRHEKNIFRCLVMPVCHRLCQSWRSYVHQFVLELDQGLRLHSDFHHDVMNY